MNHFFKFNKSCNSVLDTGSTGYNRIFYGPRFKNGVAACFMILSIMALASCGFEPMYGKGLSGNNTARAEIQNELAQIEISNIPDAEGVYLRNALIDRFYQERRPDAPLYHLSVSPLQEQIIDLDITKTSDATRGQLRVSTTMTLSDKQTGEVLLTRNLKSVTSYNILTSEFATRVSEDNTRRNALDDLARQIEQQIGLLFRRQGKGDI